ncbi:hypothetical protein ACI2LJ_25775 [Streptomyces sp. NPDC088090]|uniref:hypothetical protein n=1 Tax=Streptomyces sp. NPDC088090 TaxID=3365822 RepID=UPI00384F7571
MRRPGAKASAPPRRAGARWWRASGRARRTATTRLDADSPQRLASAEADGDDPMRGEHERLHEAVRDGTAAESPARARVAGTRASPLRLPAGRPEAGTETETEAETEAEAGTETEADTEAGAGTGASG